MRIKSKHKHVKYLLGYMLDGEFWATAETTDKDHALRVLQLNKDIETQNRQWTVYVSTTTFEEVV